MSSNGHRDHSLSRRALIGCGCSAIGATALVLPRSAGAADAGKIVQPAKPTPQEFIKRAFAMRDLAQSEGDRGYGAVIVNTSNLQIVGQSPSRVVTNGDPTGHAEMEAIRDAARRLGTSDLAGHDMYSSSKPCPMCEAAAYWANLNALYFGSSVTSGGAPKLCGTG